LGDNVDNWKSIIIISTIIISGNGPIPVDSLMPTIKVSIVPLSKTEFLKIILAL